MGIVKRSVGFISEGADVEECKDSANVLGLAR
jgi:hypothetical protein